MTANGGQRSGKKPARTRRRDNTGAPALIAVAACLLLLASSFLWLLGGTTTTGLAIGGPWSLTRGDGVRVSDRDFRGRYLLIYFGYSFCPDVCPTTLQAVADALRLLGSGAERLQPLFITVDPERDTAPVVRDYARRFDPRLVGLTGTPAQIAAVEREYRIHSSADAHRGDGARAIDHTAVLLLVGPDGRYLEPLPVDESAREIAGRLAKYVW